MELKSLYCPNCGAAVKPVDGLDTFHCQYCGYQIHLDGMSDEAYKARTKVKQMEHEERMQDKKDAYVRFEKGYEERILDKKIAHEQFKKKVTADEDKLACIVIAIIFPIAAALTIFFMFWAKSFV